MKVDKVKGHTAMMVANVAWGLMSPISKAVLTSGYINAWVLVSFRVMGAALAFWIASLFVKHEKVPIKHLALLVLASLFGIMLNQGVFILGVSYTTPINASIVTTTLPIIAMIIAAFYLKEPITWLKFIGIVVGASGALLLILNSQSAHQFGGGAESMKGILFCLTAQFSYAIYFVMFKPLISQYSGITIMKWMFLFAAIGYIPFTLPQLMAINYQTLPLNIFGDIAFVVFAGTFFSYLLIPIGQRYLRPTVATMYNNVQPIVATIAAVIWHMDVFGPIKILAIVLVFGGVYIVTQSKARVAE